MTLEQALKKIEELQILNNKLQKRIDNLERIMYDDLENDGFDDDYESVEYFND